MTQSSTMHSVRTKNMITGQLTNMTTFNVQYGGIAVHVLNPTLSHEAIWGRWKYGSTHSSWH